MLVVLFNDFSQVDFFRPRSNRLFEPFAVSAKAGNISRQSINAGGNIFIINKT